VIVRLKDEGIIEQVGGLDYVQRLTDGVPGIGFLEQYLGIVLEKYRLRAALKAAATLAYSVYELEGTSEELLADAEETITELQLAGGTKREVALNQVISPVMQDLANYHRGGAQMHGLLNTGIDYTDKFLGGMGGRNGNYIVISARPGLGKTSIATQIALHAALDFEWWEPVLENGKPVMEMGAEDEERPKVMHRKGIPVAIFSLEMATDALVHRMLFQRARADMQRWRTGFAEKGDIEPIEVAAEEFLATNNIWIDDEGRSTIDSLKAKARRMFRQHGIKLFVIDYVQLMRSRDRRFRDDRVQELAEISGEIQALGKELYVPIIVLAQMNRDYEKDPTRAPRLSDLKDCGSIEQDADLVGFLYQPKLKTEKEAQYLSAMNQVYGEDWSKFPSRVDLLWAKNRYGPTGKNQLLFQRSCTRFEDYEKWLKEHDIKPPAKGEGKPKDDEPKYERGIDPEDADWSKK